MTATVRWRSDTSFYYRSENLKSFSYNVSCMTETSGDVFSFSNNQGQTILTSNDIPAMQGQEPKGSAKTAVENALSRNINEYVRHDHESSPNSTDFTRSKPSGNDTHLDQRSDEDTVSQGSTAPAEWCESGGVAVDGGSDSSNPASFSGDGTSDSGTGSSDTGCGLSTDGGSPAMRGPTSVTNQGSVTGPIETISSPPEPSNPVPVLPLASDPIVTLDTTPPAVTDALGTDGVTVKGGGDPNTAVTITESGKVVGEVESNATGVWSFNAASLDPGAHSLVANETDAAGNTGAASPLAVTISDPRFAVVNTATSASVLLHGADYAGPVGHLQAAYKYTGADSSVISALVGNVFIHAGAGENAAAAKDGNNVLAGGDGSSWLVGASGADGGTDTFFLSAQGGQPSWNTLLNFHIGDMLTLWDFNSASGSTRSVGNQGANGAKGETISVDFGHGSGASMLVTFAGLSSTAQFTSTTGSTGGLNFDMLTRTA